MPGLLHPGPRPPARDSPWIPRGPDPPLPASRRRTTGKKEEAPADSAIVTAAAAAAAAQQRPARARAPPAPPLLPQPRSRLPLLRPAPARALPAEPAPRPPRAPPKGGAGCARAPALKGSVPVKGVGGARASATSRVGAERSAERPAPDTRPPPWPAPRPACSYQHRPPPQHRMFGESRACSRSLHPHCRASSPHHVPRPARVLATGLWLGSLSRAAACHPPDAGNLCDRSLGGPFAGQSQVFNATAQSW